MHFCTVTLLTLKRPDDSTHKETRKHQTKYDETRNMLQCRLEELLYYLWSWAGHHPQVHHQFRGTSQAWRMDWMLEEGQWRTSNCCFDAQNMHFPGGMPRISSCQPRLCTLEAGRWNDETVRLNGTCHIMLTCFIMFQYFQVWKWLETRYCNGSLRVVCTRGMRVCFSVRIWPTGLRTVHKVPSIWLWGLFELADCQRIPGFC